MSRKPPWRARMRSVSQAAPVLGQQKPPTRRARGGFGVKRRSALAGLDRVRQLRSDLEQVADNAVVGDLEDGRLFVLVDRDDGLGGLHAGAVLDGPGDAQRDVELRGHRLT